MIVAHGSKNKGIESLVPYYYGGCNGSHDGVGVNMTNNPSLALNYAGPEGAIYIVDLDLTNFIKISESTTLTKTQANKLTEIFSDLDDQVKYRLATDICGKKTEEFNDEITANKVFKRHALKHATLGLYLDRLKPTVDFGDYDKITILSAKKEFDLEGVSTQRLHYSLNLYDNYYATEVFKKICNGLILEVDQKHTNYLSFRFEERVITEFAAKEMNKDDIIKAMQHPERIEAKQSVMNITP